jgi:multidrug efflux system membrane fusion protein
MSLGQQTNSQEILRYKLNYPIQTIKNDSAFFIASSLISLDSQGILGIKIILNDKVSFLPIEVLSDVGTGYWIKLKKLVTQDILIITQGSEYVKDGDLINFKFEEDVQ